MTNNLKLLVFGGGLVGGRVLVQKLQGLLLKPLLHYTELLLLIPAYAKIIS